MTELKEDVDSDDDGAQQLQESSDEDDIDDLILKGEKHPDKETNEAVLRNLKTQQVYQHNKEKLWENQDAASKLQEVVKLSKKDEAEKLKEKADIHKRWKRALRRLAVIQRFATACQIYLDPLEYDILKLNAKRFAATRKEAQDTHHCHCQHSNKTEFELTLNKIDIEAFFKADYLVELKTVQIALGKILKQNSDHFKRLSAFLERGVNHKDELREMVQGSEELKSLVHDTLTEYYTEEQEAKQETTGMT